MIRALTRHRIPVILLLLEVTVTFSGVVNIANLVAGYRKHTNVITGVDSENLCWLTSTSTIGSGPNASYESDVAALRRAADVRHASMVSAIPLSGRFAYTIKVRSGELNDGSSSSSAGMFFWTRGALDTLGAHLEFGRDFLPLEYVEYSFLGANPAPASVLITDTLAKRLFGTDNAVGKRISLQLIGDSSATIVGVIRHLASPILHYRPEDDFNVILPVLHVPGIYVVQSNDGRCDKTLAAAKTALYEIDPNRVITRSEAFTDTERAYFRGDRSLIWILSCLTACLAMLTAVAVISISNYWVAQRQLSIGIRRALGATQSDILKYFLLENIVLMSIGLVVGLGGAVALNIALMRWFEVAHLSLGNSIMGMFLFIALGQIAVLLPAIRASGIKPSVISNAE
jgi:putative ABC transport system permease protein